MSLKRGDVVLAWFPFSSASGGKRRPCLIVQNDRDNARLANTIVVQITTNLRAAGQSTSFLVEVNTPAGQQSGLLHDSLVSCINLATIEKSLIANTIGSLPASAMALVDECLCAALEL